MQLTRNFTITLDQTLLVVSRQGAWLQAGTSPSVRVRELPHQLVSQRLPSSSDEGGSEWVPFGKRPRVLKQQDHLEISIQAELEKKKTCLAPN